jgi:ABC-type multidrug transport system ATPase subunit
MASSIIQTHQLSRNFGKIQAVKSVDLDVKEGSVYAFLGPNGAGKTTTIRMLLGLIKPGAGEVKLFGQDPKKDRIAILRKIGALVETPSLYGHLTARENLRITRKLTGADKSRIDEVLKIVDLLPDANRKAKNYSLGMKQRLGLAQALLPNPQLLILDEPTNGLDPAGIQSVRELTRSFPKEFGITVFLSSHLLGEVEKVATNVGIIQNGKLLFQGAKSELDAMRTETFELLAEPADATAAILEKMELDFAIGEDGSFSISNIKKPEVPKLNNALVEAGVSVYKLNHQKPSLEDLFISITEEGGEKND